MDLVQALLVAVLQGATELFPVSSLGHAVVVPALIGWNLDQNGAAFLPFLVMLHVGTAVALLAYFRGEWWNLAVGVLGFGEDGPVIEARRLFILIIIATIPAVVLGFALEKLLRGLFGSPAAAAFFLIVNAVVLIAGEQLREREQPGRNLHRPLTEMTAMDALMIGIWQCGALIPGISRSGTTMVGALLRGIDHAASAHFSFLIATPIILGATVLEVPKLLRENVPPNTFTIAAISAVAAGLVAFGSTAFLMRYFASHDKMALKPFAYYCLALGICSLGWFLLA
jgi:undecaprenyl-diphosphatase